MEALRMLARKICYRMWTALFVLIVLTLICVTSADLSASAKKKKAKGDPDFTPLMTAAFNCDLNQVTTLLQQGLDVKAIDAEGNDALTVASTQRTMDKKKGFVLECPEVVSALVKAGANPGDATFYQSPELEHQQPTRIAVLRVEDDRENKLDSAKIMEHLTEGVEQALSQRIPRITPVITPHYPILRLKETHQNLKAAGFSDDLEFSLTDCRTKQLLWRRLGASGEARGFITKAFIKGFTVLCEELITMPRYRESEK
jgi:ankyrin repeat protein